MSHSAKNLLYWASNAQGTLQATPADVRYCQHQAQAWAVKIIAQGCGKQKAKA